MEMTLIVLVMGCCSTKITPAFDDTVSERVPTANPINGFLPREAWTHAPSVSEQRVLPHSTSLEANVPQLMIGSTSVEQIDNETQTETDEEETLNGERLCTEKDTQTEPAELFPPLTSTELEPVETHDAAVQVGSFASLQPVESSSSLKNLRGSLTGEELDDSGFEQQQWLDQKSTSTQTQVLTKNKHAQTNIVGLLIKNSIPLGHRAVKSCGNSPLGGLMNTRETKSESHLKLADDWQIADRPMLQTNSVIYDNCHPMQEVDICKFSPIADSQLTGPTRSVPMFDVGVQTISRQEDSNKLAHATLPPPFSKHDLLSNSLMKFTKVDEGVADAPSDLPNLRTLCDYLSDRCGISELLRVRAIFMWIVSNVYYDWSLLDKTMPAETVYHMRRGVSLHYAILFEHMCSCMGLAVESVRGFAKDHTYRPGHLFRENEPPSHVWNAVFVCGSWRLVDCTWGSGYMDSTGKFIRSVNEFYFLTDPEKLGWTHLPHSTVDPHYNKWQLVASCQTLAEFNSLPKVTPWFFSCQLRFHSAYSSPLVFSRQTEVLLHCQHSVMRFKYKMYRVYETECSSMNGYVFCSLRGGDRKTASFSVRPPEPGAFFLKIFSRAEQEIMTDESLPFYHVATLLLRCDKCRAHVQPWPVNDMPWGVTGFLHEIGARVQNQEGPVIVTWGGRYQLVIEPDIELITMTHIYDVNGTLLDSDSIVRRKDSEGDIIILIHPPQVGMYKLMLYAMPRPFDKGQWKLPLVAVYLIDAKLVPNANNSNNPSGNKHAAEKKIRLKPRAR